MKTHLPSRPRNYVSILLFFAVCLLTTAPVTRAIDLSEALPVQRYTIINSTSFRSESGRLLRSGLFQVLSSSILPMPLFADPEELAPVSGRTIVDRVIYEGAANAGVIPRWVRSVGTYWVGPEEFVIVSVKGGPDPNPTPVFTTQPVDQVYIQTGDPLFLFAWSDTDWVSYQWLRNGKPIPGQTFAFLGIDICSRKDSGKYSLRANVGGAVATSDAATVMVLDPILIRRDVKTNITARAGRNVVLRVSATGSSPSYRWYHNANPIENAFSSRLVLRHVTNGNAGMYYCVITNHVSYNYSSDAVLTITP